MENAIIKPVQTETHFLSRYEFKYGLNSGPRGESGWTNTYWHDNNSKILWITIDFDNQKAYFYDEYECGGCLSSYALDIPYSEEALKSDPVPFIEWLNQMLPDNMS